METISPNTSYRIAGLLAVLLIMPFAELSRVTLEGLRNET